MGRVAEHQRRQPLGAELTPVRFEATMRRLHESHGLHDGILDALVATAQEAGRETIDAIYSLPPDSGAAILEMSQMWDEVDGYCRRGPYSLLATPPDCKRLRDWFLQECLSETDGAAASRWPDFASARA
jgi:hypothetical protein